MGDERVEDIIRKYIIEIAEDMEIEKVKITNTAHFVEDMGFDSMALLEIMNMLEKGFKISVPASEYPNLTSIEKCAEVIRRNQVNRINA